jgi:dTDP-4-amino-4,6-dideoxygalactose transaminase
VIRHPARDALADTLRQAGVHTLVHYPIPPHLSGAYAGRWERGSFPVAERLAQEVLSLPIGPHLGTASQEHVISTLLRALETFDAATTA